MRFFSNENREPNDEPSNVDVQTRAAQENAEKAHDEHPERVQSDPVSVPQQRSGSPWSDTPPSPAATDADAELADQEQSDGTEEAPGYAGADREAIALGSGPDEATGDAPEASTDTVSAVAHDHDTADDAVTEPTEAEPADAGQDVDAHDHGPQNDAVDLALDDTTAPSDEAPADEPDSTPASTTTTYGPDGTVTTTENGSTPVGDSDDDAEPALKDEGGSDDPTAVDPVTDKPLDTDTPDSEPTSSTDGDSDTDTGSSDADTAPKPRPSEMSLAETADGAPDDETAGHDEPATAPDAVDAAAPFVPIAVPVGAAAGETGTAADPAGTPAATPAEASAPGGDMLPGSVTEPEVGKIFSAADAQSFQDRWRDVQLRFVDGPKDATTEAAALLDEVVDKLASSLRAQKDSLSNGNSDDTEQLRVELRGYREILNRVLAI
jgi:hypothetical protein